MRVVHINYDAAVTGGASIAMLRIHRALMAEGHESLILCRVKAEEPEARVVKVSFCRQFAIFVGKVVTKLLSGCCHSSGLFPTGMANEVNKVKPDLVVLHWLQSDTIAIQELLKIKAPMVWYHHDLWPIRGLTAHEWFPVPKRLGWLDMISQWNKRRVARKLGNRLVPACASKWVARQIEASGMYAVAPVVLPLPIDPCFTPGKKRQKGRFRILNGARGGFELGLKGGDRLLAALREIPQNEKDDMELVVFGAEGSDETREGVAVHYVGRLFGDELAQQYRDADVFAFPSRQETYGQTKLEALACGTPVVAFDETACAEGIEHKKDGWIAPADDIVDYAKGIQWFFSKWKAGNAIRVAGFDYERYNKKIVEMWQSLVKDVA